MGTLAEPHFLSTHSSNPLQVPSDDVLNQEFVEHIRPLLDIEKARAAQGLSPRTSTPSLLQVSHQDDIPSDDDEEYGNGQFDVTIQPLDYQHPAGAGSMNPTDQYPPEDGEDDGVEVQISQYGSMAYSQSEGFEDGEDDDDDLFGDEETTLTIENQLLLERYHDENTILLREPEDQARVQAEIDDLERAVPRILGEYVVMDRLGEGTFSSVYKALDLARAKAQQRPSYKPQLVGVAPTNCIVALKRIYVTSSPIRIANELSILMDCKDCRNVSILLSAFRFRDQVVAVMPYVPNQDFRELYTTMSIPNMQGYFRCLFRALGDIHALGIVHRDVKPANFLFNPFENSGTLCDFGLAQRLEHETPSNTCLHTASTLEFPQGLRRLLKEQHRTRAEQRMKEARKKSNLPSERVGVPAEDSRPALKANRAGTRGFRAPEVLFKCQDQSVALDVWSAGTIMLCILSCKFPIFTASDDVEALMELAAVFGRTTMEKCAKLHGRTFSTNVPSVDHPGMTWGDFASHINPYLFQTAVPPPAATSSSSISSTVSSSDTPTVNPFKRTIKRLPQRSSSFLAPSQSRHHPYVPPSSLPPSSQLSFTQSSSSQPHLPEPENEPEVPSEPQKLPTEHNRLIDSALDLLGKCLHWDVTKRITAKDALEHPFLLENAMYMGEGEDNEYRV